MPEGELLYERDERLALITFNRPRVHNAINYDMITRFNDAVRRAEEVSSEKMGKLTAGMPMPPGMKFPF